MPKRPNYCCIRCGYETDSKSHMHKHLFLKNTPCPQTKNNIELTDEIKQYILDNRIYLIPPKVKPIKTLKHPDIALTEEIKKLKMTINLIKFQKNEAFYQNMVEKYLNGTHMKLPCGITDVTTDKIHAEIKKWTSFKQAYGQLMCYNDDSPRDILQVYLFGTANKKLMTTAYDKLTKFNIEVYTFISDGKTYQIIKYDTDEIVYSMTIDDIIEE